MWKLNLPEYTLRVKNKAGKPYIFDPFRKKMVALSPEEWVRQNFLRFLVDKKNFPEGYIACETQIELNGLKKRCDAVVYNQQKQPIIIIEFKAPTVTLSQETFDQAATYNSKLQVNYLIVSNGLQHIACKVDFENGKYIFAPEIPDFSVYIS